MTKPDAINLLRRSRIARLPPRPAQGAHRQRAGGSSPSRTGPPANTPKRRSGAQADVTRRVTTSRELLGSKRRHPVPAGLWGFALPSWGWEGKSEARARSGTRGLPGSSPTPRGFGVWILGAGFGDSDHFAIIQAVRRERAEAVHTPATSDSAAEPRAPRSSVLIPKTPFFSCVSPRQTATLTRSCPLRPRTGHPGELHKPPGTPNRRPGTGTAHPKPAPSDPDPTCAPPQLGFKPFWRVGVNEASCFMAHASGNGQVRGFPSIKRKTRGRSPLAERCGTGNWSWLAPSHLGTSGQSHPGHAEPS